MDPTANLEEIRNMLLGDKDTKTARLSELINALDQWIAGGGFLPMQWRPHHKTIINNKDRAERAQRAITEYADNGEEDQTTLQDLLGDLRHFADARDLNFDQAFSNGSCMYDEEVEEENLPIEEEKTPRPEAYAIVLSVIADRLRNDDFVDEPSQYEEAPIVPAEEIKTAAWEIIEFVEKAGFPSGANKK